MPSGRTFYHTVRHGESMGTIAKRYGVSADDLRRWNGLSQNTVHSGQRLRVTTDVVTGGKAPKRAAATPPGRVSGTIPPRGASINATPAGKPATLARPR